MVGKRCSVFGFTKAHGNTGGRLCAASIFPTYCKVGPLATLLIESMILGECPFRLLESYDLNETRRTIGKIGESIGGSQARAPMKNQAARHRSLIVAIRNQS